MTTFNENIERLNKAKSDIRAAIEEKGIFVGDGLIDGYADKIKQIKVQGKTQNKTVEVKKNNSTTTVKSDDGFIGLDKVTINTRIPIQDKKSETVNTNGTYIVSVDDEYEGMKIVEIDVNIPLQEDKFEEFTDNGYYNVSVDDGYVGMKNVEISINLPLQEDKTVVLNDNGNYNVSMDDGYVGMKNVDITVDIPFEEKTQTINTNGTYTILPEGDNKAIKSATITVDVKGDGKIKLPNGITFVGSTWSEFDMGEYDWSDHYCGVELFRNCSNLERLLNFPENIDFRGSVSRMFNECLKLVEAPYFSMEHIANTTSMFARCQKLQTVPQYNMKYVRCAYQMFAYTNIVTLPKFDFSSMVKCDGLLLNSSFIKNLGGFENIRCNLSLNTSPQLTVESCANVINGLYDFVGNYITPNSNEGTLTFAYSTLSNLDDELIASGVAKGWIIKS